MALGVFVLVPAVLLVVLPLRMSTRALDREVTTRVATSAATNADNVHQMVRDVRALVSFAAADPTIIANVENKRYDAEARSVMQKLQRSNINIRTAGLIGADGRALAAEPEQPGVAGTDFSYRDYFKGAMSSDATFVSGAFISSSGRESKRVAISTAIRDQETNAKIGVLVASIDVMPSLQRYVDDIQRDHQVAVTIVDECGNVIAAPHLGPAMQKTNDAHYRAASSGRSWVGTTKSSQGSSVVAYRPVADSNWSVSAAVDSSIAYSSISELRSSVLAIAAVLGLVLTALLVLFARSIKARDRAHGLKQAGDERTRAILDSAIQGYFELDVEGRIVEWNKVAEVIFGVSRDEALFKSAADVVHADGVEQKLQRAMQMMSSDGADAERISTEFVVRRPYSGVQVTVQVHAWCTTLDGETRLSALVTDVSERAQLDEQREAIVRSQRRVLEELRQADLAKSDFISTISHELRTPLTSIVGYLEMLTEGFGGDLTQQQTSMLSVVERNSKRLMGLIDDVLTISRMESGSYRANFEPVPVASVVEAVEQSFLPQLSERMLHLEVEVEPNLGAVFGDHAQLERAMFNLVSNAIKFTPEGGKVGLTAKRSGNTVQLSVSDTGVGIPLEEQHRLFSRFFRSSTAQEQAIQGTGLGLAIVKGIVERHGGSVKVESTLNVGTTVSMELPAAAPVAVPV